MSLASAARPPRRVERSFHEGVLTTNSRVESRAPSAPDSRIGDRPIAPLILLGLLMLGGFSFARIDSRWNWGLYGELRYWVACFLVVVVLGRAMADGCTQRDRLLWRWLFLVTTLHGLVALSVLWSPTPPITGVAAVMDLGLLSCILLVSVIIFGPSPQAGVNLLLRALYWTSLALVVVGVVTQGGVVGEISQMGAGSIGMSRIVGIGIIAAIYLWKKTKQLSWLYPVPVFLSSILLSDTRAAVLGLGISVLLMVFAKTSLARGISAAMLFSLATAALFVAGPGREAARTFWESVWAGGEIYISGRDRLFSDAWDLFLRHPVFGIGHGGYYSDYADSTYPHNLVLNVAVDTGVLGLSILTAAMMLAVARWFRPRSLEHTVAATVGIYSLVCCMFAGTYYDARFMWLFFFLYMLPGAPQVPAATPHHPYAAVAWRSHRLSPARSGAPVNS